MRTAIILGATGLVGYALLRQLLGDERFDKVKIFVRKSTNMRHHKLEEHIINFDKPDEWKHLVHGDILFSAFGTTLRKAGSKEAQYKIDYTYQYQMAEAAFQNRVGIYILISAAFSSTNSKIFYSRMKAELERDIQKLSFNSIHILRPGMLAGDRKEFRLGEKMSIKLMSMVSLIPGLDKFKPIQANIVSKAMINAALSSKNGVHTYTLSELFTLAKGSK